MNSDTYPGFWKDVQPRLVRRETFWIPGERVDINGQIYQRGPLFAEWEAPEEVTHPWPIVLVHGGGYQSTEWLDTPDGRPGWAQRLVEAGYAVVLVDRPGQGRSPFHPKTMGEMGPPFSYEGVAIGTGRSPCRRRRCAPLWFLRCATSRHVWPTLCLPGPESRSSWTHAIARQPLWPRCKRRYHRRSCSTLPTRHP